MRASNAPFTEQGFAELIRDVERHELLLTAGGDTNPGSGTNAGYTNAPTTSQTQDGGGTSVAQAISAHEAKANPHPQYAVSMYGFQGSIVASGGIASGSGTMSSWDTTNSQSRSFDTTGGAFDGTTFTAPSAGYYRIDVHGYYDVSPASASYAVTFNLKINATEVSTSTGFINSGAAVARAQGSVSLNGLYNLAVGDTVVVSYTFSNTTSLNNAHFSVQKVA
jgi:hypothetical protein